MSTGLSSTRVKATNRSSGETQEPVKRSISSWATNSAVPKESVSLPSVVIAVSRPEAKFRACRFWSRT